MYYFQSKISGEEHIINLKRFLVLLWLLSFFQAVKLHLSKKWDVLQFRVICFIKKGWWCWWRIFTPRFEQNVSRPVVSKSHLQVSHDGFFFIAFENCFFCFVCFCFCFYVAHPCFLFYKNNIVFLHLIFFSKLNLKEIL